MNAPPVWYGQPRGTSLADLTTIDFSEDDLSDKPPNFLELLRAGLFGAVDDRTAGVVGWWVVSLPILGVAILAAAESWWAGALVALVGVAWTMTCAKAALQARSAAAREWAISLVDFLVVTGRVATAAIIVLSIILIALLVSSILGALRRQGSRS